MDSLDSCQDEVELVRPEEFLGQARLMEIIEQE